MKLLGVFFKNAHLCGVGSLAGRVPDLSGLRLDLATEAEVGHFADEILADEDVASRQIPVDVVHLRQVLHPRSDPPQHTHQLQHLGSRGGGKEGKVERKGFRNGGKGEGGRLKGKED